MSIFAAANETNLHQFFDEHFLLDARKFVIGLWLGITSLTFAFILHVGRCSIKTANALNKVLWDITAAASKVVSIPNQFLKLLHSATGQQDEKAKKDEKASSVQEEANTDKESQEFKGDDAPSVHESQSPGQQDEKTKTDKKASSVEGVANAGEENLQEFKGKDTPSLHESPEQLQEATQHEPEHSTDGIELATPGQNNLRQEELELETDFVPHEAVTTKEAPKTNESDPKVTVLQEEELDHAFAYFAKGIRKFSTTSIILLVAFVIYDTYVYTRNGRKYSYDWFILFPFPFWFLLVLSINICAFIITEIVLYCKPRKVKKLVQPQEKQQSSTKKSFRNCGKAFTLFVNFFTTLSATTLPVFVFFHFFWITIASTTFALRIASSALFYIPLIIFVFWFLSITSWILRVWKKLIKKEIKKETTTSLCIRVLKLIPLFLRPLIPYLFLPFWCLLLATLHMFSSFLNNVVNIEDQNFLVTVGIIVGIIGITKKIANNCKPKVHDDDEEDVGAEDEDDDTFKK